jgi:hypothetical protein
MDDWPEMRFVSRGSIMPKRRNFAAVCLAPTDLVRQEPPDEGLSHTLAGQHQQTAYTPSMAFQYSAYSMPINVSAVDNS